MSNILIVEDNHDEADSLRLILEGRGHQVRVAYDGAEGLALFKEWTPDVVLADLGLPKIDGFCLAKALQPTGVRLIAITGLDGPEIGSLVRESGFERLLVKPADPGFIVGLMERGS
jgi:DNA-binding response OmpR family regulator